MPAAHMQRIADLAARSAVKAAATKTATTV